MSVATSSKISGLLTGAFVVVFVAYSATRLIKALHAPLSFDDSYMFYRYALHVRQGLGISWNLDGVHTYGETAPLWGFCVLLLSFLPISAPHALILGSWVCAMGAVVTMAWAVTRNAKSATMKSIWRVLPMVGLPLALAPVYRANALTGMETMFVAMLVGVFVGLALEWEQGAIAPGWVALGAMALFLTRPEAALVVVLLPIMLTLSGRGRKQGLAALLSLFFGGVALDLLVCRMYFGTALPLSFYMKSGHAYEGYHYAWHPVMSGLRVVANCLPFLAGIVLLCRREDWRLLSSFAVPTLAVFGYLCTITQIMGWDSRYYAPYFALLVVPSLLTLDRWLVTRTEPVKLHRLRRRAVIAGGVAIVVVLLVVVAGRRRCVALVSAVESQLENRPFLYDPVVFVQNAAQPLPDQDWYTTIHGLADTVLVTLPRGATIASSEVGYLGAAAGNVNVIDLEGLNDNRIALNGFRVDELLQRKPDIIWMPHTDYTYQRGLLLTNPSLLEQYDSYGGAAIYGLALRKDSPYRSQIDRQWGIFWRDFYPEYPMKDYLVHSACWTGRKYRPADD